MLDEYRQAMVRDFRGSVEILGPGQPEPENNGIPPTLYPQPDFESGTPEWERRKSGFGPALAVQTWVIEDKDDYDEVMSEIHDQLYGVVKLLDPYLQPDRLSEFVDRAENDAEIWRSSDITTTI